MDSFINAGKNFLEQQMQQGGQGQGQDQQGQGQGNNNLPGGNNAYGGNYPAGGDFGNANNDLSDAQQHASNHAGSSGDNDIFSNVIGAISQNQGHLANNNNIDEQDALRAHQENYGQDGGNATNSGMGAAAAIQALKSFTQGSSGGNQSQSAFLGLAMGEASKLFDNKAANGQLADGASKESVVQQAGEMAMKMYFNSQGGGSGGGAANLMSLASKFLG